MGNDPVNATPFEQGKSVEVDDDVPDEGKR